MSLVCTLLASLGVLAGSGVMAACNTDEFIKHKVVPDVIAENPSSILSAIYGGKKVNLGNELTPTDVKPEPSLKWAGDSSSLYTILFTDVDVKPLDAYIHWMVVNVPGNDISKGNTVYTYRGAAPRKEGGLHRYVFQVFKQSKELKRDVLDSLKDTELLDRAQVPLPKFITDNQLNGPIAANFFTAKYDDSVPQIHADIMAHYGVTSIPVIPTASKV